ARRRLRSLEFWSSGGCKYLLNSFRSVFREVIISRNAADELDCGLRDPGLSSDSESGKRIRFGPYEADLAAGELRKNGRRVHLQEQPFQLLMALLERPGEVVTRDELRELAQDEGLRFPSQPGQRHAQRSAQQLGAS